MSKSNLSLSAEQLAALFSQLKSLELAGLPSFQALDILRQSGKKLNKPLALMQSQLRTGRAISEAGFRAGLFNEAQQILIHAGESSGSLAEVYGQLANHYTDLSSRIKKVKSRLYFPAMTLIISLFVQPLHQFISSEISGFDYLWIITGRILVLGLGLFLLARLPRILRDLGVESAWHRLQLKIPVVAKWIIKRQVNEFLVILAMMLESGLAFSEALPKAVASINNSLLKNKFILALRMLDSGASVTDTLGSVPIINTTILNVVKSSEQSGRLASGIHQFTRQEAVAIKLQDELLTEWLPRVAYSIIAIWIAYSILGSQLASIVQINR